MVPDPCCFSLAMNYQFFQVLWIYSSSYPLFHNFILVWNSNNLYLVLYFFSYNILCSGLQFNHISILIAFVKKKKKKKERKEKKKNLLWGRGAFSNILDWQECYFPAYPNQTRYHTIGITSTGSAASERWPERRYTALPSWPSAFRTNSSYFILNKTKLKSGIVVKLGSKLHWITVFLKVGNEYICFVYWSNFYYGCIYFIVSLGFIENQVYVCLILSLTWNIA